MGRRRPNGSHLELLLGQLSSAAMWTTDGDLRVTSATGGALELIGVDGSRDLIGKTLSELDASTAVVDAHLRALDGQPENITELWGDFAFDLHLEPLQDKGVVVGVGGIAVDASKRRVAEHAFTESEARFRMLVERLPIITYVNPLGLPIRTTYMSPYVEHVLGFPVERWLTESDFFTTRLHPDDQERVLAAAHRTHETGEPFRETYRLIAKDGHAVRFLDETMTVYDDRGRPLFLQGFLVEVGEDARSEPHSLTG